MFTLEMLGRHLVAEQFFDDKQLQFQADLLGVPVAVAPVAETTASGAGYLAGVGEGLWSEQDLAELARPGRRYEPQPDGAEDERLAEWRRAVERARGRAKPA